MPPRLPPAAFAEAKEASMGEHVRAYVISDKDATYTSDHHRTGIRDYTFTCSSIGLVLTDTALGAVRIDRVLPDSPANEQGIAPRSTIIAINAQSIRLSAAEVATLISTLPRPITLRLQDDELIWEDEASSQRFARIPVVPRTGDNDFNYAVPVALSLFMRVALEGALVFTALFMLSLPTIRDNLMRSEARAACRDAGSTVAGYQALTNLGNASKAELKHLEAKLKFPPAECGWEGLPIRRFQHASIWKVVQGSILGSSLGGCNEYRDCDTRVLARCDQAVLPMGMFAEHPTVLDALEHPTVSTGKSGLLVEVSTARWCAGSEPTGSGTTPWSDFSMLSMLLCIVLVILFLVRIRWLAGTMAKAEDEAMITTADYALWIKGLDESLPPHELLQRLKANIERLTYLRQPGYFKGKVHHVEVARRCREEKVTAEAILRLEEVVDELACQRAFLLARRKPCDATRTALANLVPRFERLRAQLRFLASEEEESTGHAFVVFEHELDRNRFYLLFNPPAKAGNVLANASAAAKAVLDLELASPKAVEVARAAVEHAERELREAMASSRVAEGCETFMLETVDSLHYCLGFEKLGDGLVVQAAPEPREIIWEALELDQAHERVMVLLGTLAILMIVLAGAVALLAAKIAQAYFGMADLGGWSPVVEPATTLGVMIVTIAFNVIIRMVTVAMVHWEAQDTQALEQSSIFSKLSLGLVTNSVFLPFTTAVLLSGGDVGSQAWYEPGGLIATSALLIVCGYIVDVQNAFNPSAILAKYIHSRLAYSPRTLKRLWQPKPLDLGAAYSYAFVAFSMGLLLGPLFPIAYLLTALGLALKWICTRFALRHWHSNSCPSVDQEMMLTFRWRLGQVLGLSLVVQCLALANSTGTSIIAGTFFIGASVLLGAYTVAPLGYFQSLARFDQLASLEDTDTGNCSFSEAQRRDPRLCACYACPKLHVTAHSEEESVAAQHGHNDAVRAMHNIAAILQEFGVEDDDLGLYRE